MYIVSNKLLNEDGSVTKIDGTVVDMATSSEIYKNSAPIANKIREPDGSISKITDYIGGGGEGTTNYNNLSNKPSINGITLEGNKKAEDLKLADKDTVDMLDNEVDTLSKDSVSLSKTTIQTIKSPIAVADSILINSDSNAFKIEVNNEGSVISNSNSITFDKLPKTNDTTGYSSLESNHLITKKVLDTVATSMSVSGDKYGIKADYATRFGILDCPNGLIDYSPNNKEIEVQAGVVLKMAGSDIKTMIASNSKYTLEAEEGSIILFLARTESEGGTIQIDFLEASDVFYQEEEPSDGVSSFLAWWKPSLGLWQFKSNYTGNIWRTAVATPIANINVNTTGVTSINYIGYRIIDDDIFAQLSDIEAVNGNIETINNNVNSLLSFEEKVNNFGLFTDGFEEI